MTAPNVAPPDWRKQQKERISFYSLDPQKIKILEGGKEITANSIVSVLIYFRINRDKTNSPVGSMMGEALLAYGNGAKKWGKLDLRNIRWDGQVFAWESKEAQIVINTIIAKRFEQNPYARAAVLSADEELLREIAKEDSAHGLFSEEWCFRALRSYQVFKKAEARR